MNDDPEFIRGVALLEKHGLAFEVWQSQWRDIPNVTALARRFPNVTIVLNHLGGKVNPTLSASEVEEWRGYISDIAGCENVVCKIGGAQINKCGYGFPDNQATSN